MSLACLILAAGQGTRMRSSLPKVLHPIAGRALVRHVVVACQEAKADKIVVVVAPDMNTVREAVAPCVCAVQDKPLGTGHAVKAAREALAGHDGDILVLFGDTPLVTSATLHKFAERKKETGAAIIVGGFEPADPSAYGRLVVRTDGQLEAIVEAIQASPEQQKIGLCNGGIMLFDSKNLWSLLDQVGNDNPKGEYFLTDCIELANRAGLKVSTILMPEDEVAGVNTKVQLAALEKIMQRRLREKHMLAGVTMTDPDTVFLCADTKLGQDVVIGPNVVFGPKVSVADNVEIRAFSYLEDVEIDVGAIIGPYARLRPGSKIGAGAHIGNFVEIKKSVIGTGAKVNHLSYIGDASVGAKTNIGAGTITCNYDGYNKMPTQIGTNAFVGSNSTLVAPVMIGDGAFVAAGSTVTQDVPNDALAVARERQTNNDGWAARFRAAQGQTGKVGRA